MTKEEFTAKWKDAVETKDAVRVLIIEETQNIVVPMSGVTYTMKDGVLTGNGFGIRIKKNLCLIEDVTLFRFVRTVNAVAVLQIFDVQSHDDHGVDITDTTGIGKRKDCEGFLFSGVEKKKLAGCTVAGMCGKVDSVGKRSSAI